MKLRNRRDGLLLLLGLALCVPAEAGWRAEHVSGAVLRDGGQRVADGEPLAEHATLALEADAALTLRAEGARLRLRGPATIQLYERTSDGSARLVLREGALRASTDDNGGVKVNAGGLRLRLRNGEAWAQSDDSDRVCALQGSVAVQQADKPATHHLRETGACLILDADDKLLQEWPDRRTLNEWLARADGGSRPLPPYFRPLRGQTRTPEAPEGPATEGAVAWYVALGAFSERERARTLLEQAGVEGTILRTDAGLFRSLAGPYEHRDAAEARRDSLRSRYPDAWLLEHTP